MSYSRFWHILLFIGLSFIVSCSYLPEEDGQNAYLHLKDEAADYLLLYSGEKIPTNAFLFIPGGFVDPHAYLDWADRLLELHENVAVIIVKYPSNLAITNMKKVLRVKDAFEFVEHWIIGGHSLGGVVAGTLVYDSPDDFDGLVLMGSWSREATDLSDWSGCVLSMYASQDMLATVEEVFENKMYLPPEVSVDSYFSTDELENCTFYYEIEGGNHSGFGSYGFQEGDGEASISKEEQQGEIVDELGVFFREIWE